VYHGVDTERFSPARCLPHRETIRRTLGFADDETVLLFVGHNFALKGLATLIRAAGRLVREGGPVRLAVLGNGRPRRYLRLAQRCGAGGAVRFLGASDDPLPYYAAADVCVQPTFYDAFGLTVLEAAACGLPAITSRFAGVSELLSDGRDGYIVSDPGDDAALANRLRALCDPPARRTMGHAARQLAEQHTLDRNCAKILALYEEIVQIKA
jgi:UDP-glucose:(heptosyl)LPS alpha-1,3-glucosyltransferase